MKHLLKKKSLLSIILILILMFTLCACSGSSPLAKDEDILVGTWEYLSYADYNVYTQRILEFTSDGTLISTSNYCYPTHGPYSESETFNYTCEDGVLYLEQEGSSISTKEYYRFSEDKKSLYISDPLYDILETEEKYVKVDSPTDLSSINGNNASDTETQNDNSDSESYESEQNSTTDESDYTPFGYDENIMGYWETWEDDILYAVWFNEDGTGYLSLDSDYNIVSFCCVDGYIIADFDDDSSAEIPYRFNKDKTALYLTLSDGETKFDKRELGIG